MRQRQLTQNDLDPHYTV